MFLQWTSGDVPPSVSHCNSRAAVCLPPELLTVSCVKLEAAKRGSVSSSRVKWTNWIFQLQARQIWLLWRRKPGFKLEEKHGLDVVQSNMI